MRRSTGGVDGFKVTPFGVVLLVALAAALAAVTVGSRSTQLVGIVVAAGVLLIMIGGRSGGRYPRFKTLSERRAEFVGFSRGKRPSEAETAETDAELWKRERERRERDGVE